MCLTSLNSPCFFFSKTTDWLFYRTLPEKCFSFKNLGTQITPMIDVIYKQLCILLCNPYLTILCYLFIFSSLLFQEVTSQTRGLLLVTAVGSAKGELMSITIKLPEKIGTTARPVHKVITVNFLPHHDHQRKGSNCTALQSWASCFLLSHTPSNVLRA